MNTEKIKYIRDELEITQDEISRMLGCTRSAYSLWEINKNTIPLNYLNKLSNILNINIDCMERTFTIEKFDEIIDWATMNQLTNEWGMYTNIKSENYNYLTNYLVQRTKNKEIK